MNRRNSILFAPSKATGGYLMVIALAGTIAVLSSAGFSGTARGGGFGISPMAIRAIVGALSFASTPITTEVEGVPWFDSFADASLKAKQESKPILVFQLFGKIDDAFC